MKIHSLFFAGMLALLATSCSHDSIDELYGGAGNGTEKPAVAGSKQLVKFGVSDFTGNLVDQGTKATIAEAKIKTIEYRCFKIDGDTTLFTSKHFSVNTETSLVIQDSLPKGNYLVSIVAGTKIIDSFRYPGYIDPAHPLDPPETGTTRDEKYGWTVRYDNDVFGKTFNLTVDNNAVSENITLSRIIGKIRVTVNNLYASKLPANTDYIMLCTGNHMSDIGRVFSFYTLKPVFVPFRWYTQTSWDGSTTLNRRQVEELNARKEYSYTFEMNVLPGTGKTLSLMGRKDLPVYASDTNLLFNSEINNSGLTVELNKILEFSGNMVYGTPSGITVPTVEDVWGEVVDGGKF